LLHSFISSVFIIVVAANAYLSTGMVIDEIISISVFYLLFSGCCVFMNHICAKILLANSKLVKRINEQANTDNLTGLNNRRRFFESSDQVYKHSSREHKPYAVLLVDLDHFKQINDTLGHKTGDHVLIKMASNLNNLCRRPLDMAARFGGDEFVVLLYDSTEDHINKVCQTIINETECITAALSEKAPDTQLGVSIGVAINHAHEPYNIKTLIEMADQALYTVKNNGKNGYVIAGKQAISSVDKHSDFISLA